MRNLIRNVSHSSRCAPFRTPNLAKNPARPVLAGGGTPAAAAVLSFVVGITGGKNQRKSSEWKNQSYNDRLRTPCDAGKSARAPEAAMLKRGLGRFPFARPRFQTARSDPAVRDARTADQPPRSS